MLVDSHIRIRNIQLKLFFHEPCSLLLTISSHKVVNSNALELHLAAPIAWIVAGLMHLNFINVGHIWV